MYFCKIVLLAIFLYGCPAKEPAQEEVIPEKKHVVEESNATVFPPEYEVIFMVPKGDTLTIPYGKEVS